MSGYSMVFGCWYYSDGVCEYVMDGRAGVEAHRYHYGIHSFTHNYRGISVGAW